MRKAFTITLSLLLVQILGLGQERVLSSQNGAYVNYFTVTSNVPQPVTIVTNQGTFSFRASYIVYGVIDSIEAFDVNGNRIANVAPQEYALREEKGRRTQEARYVLSASIPGTSGVVYEGQVSGDHNPYYFSAGPGKVYGFMAKDDEYWYRKTYVSIGAGAQYGGPFGVNITAKALQGVFGITGGVGMVRREAEKNAMTWYLAGLIGYKNWDIELGALNSYSTYTNKHDLGLAAMTNLNIRIYGPFGFNAGVGFLIPQKGDDIDLLLSLGLTVRLHQD